MTSDVSESIRIAQLMCSRLCHDVISPAGAVNAAVELLEDESSGSAIDPEVLGLLGRSGTETSNRLAFFRAAFGAGGGPSAEVSVAALEKLSQEALGGGKIAMQWQSDGADVLSNAAGQLLLMLVLTSTEALPRGGNVTVRIQQMDDGVGIACIAEGPGASLKETIASVLSGSVSLEQLSARDITAYYAYLLAQSVEATFETSSDEGAIMLAVLLPA